MKEVLQHKADSRTVTLFNKDQLGSGYLELEEWQLASPRIRHWPRQSLSYQSQVPPAFDRSAAPLQTAPAKCRLCPSMPVVPRSRGPFAFFPRSAYANRRTEATQGSSSTPQPLVFVVACASTRTQKFGGCYTDSAASSAVVGAV